MAREIEQLKRRGAGVGRPVAIAGGKGSKDMTTNNDKTMIRVIGLVLLVGGAGLAYWGYQLSHSLVSQFSQAFTGSLPDGVMYRYIGGAISCVAGGFLLVKK